MLLLTECTELILVVWCTIIEQYNEIAKQEVSNFKTGLYNKKKKERKKYW